MRQCDECKRKMQPYEPRKRVAGRMLCEACVTSPRGGYVSAAKVAEAEHESYYHITEDPHFTPDPHRVPSDNALSMSPRTSPGLFLTKNPNGWAQSHGYQRPYLAEVHVPKGVGGSERWGNEHFVKGEDLHKVKVHRVIPLDENIREEYGEPGRIETFHQTSHDGREMQRNWGHTTFKEPLGAGYKYSGPDVRDMSPDQHRQHYERWRDYMVGGGNEGHQFGRNEFDDKKMSLVGSDADDDYDDEGQFIMRDQHGQETGRKWAALSRQVASTSAPEPAHPTVVEARRLFGVSHTHGGRRLPVPLSSQAADRATQDARMARRDWTKTTLHQPDHDVIAGARSYAAKVGLPDPHDQNFHQVMTGAHLIRSLGRAYDALPDYQREAEPHYEAMKREVDHQFDHMTKTMGIRAEFVHHDPYANAGEMMDDVRNNKRMQVLHTADTGSHPYFSDETNNRFRAVHDFFGHAATGRDFDEHGEEAAFQAHAKMFSPHALPALTSETRGQNGSLVLNGEFAPQKVALLPSHLWSPTHPSDYARMASVAERNPMSTRSFEEHFTASLHKQAHDSGDGETIYHCPFCGSGQVIARSDRTIECEFCHVCFTVQVQPQYPAFPQTVNGVPVQVPGMPGQTGMDPMGSQDPMAGGDPGAVGPGGAPVGQAPPGQDADPQGDDDSEDDEQDDKDANPFTSSLRTHTGRGLNRQRYLAYLAARHTDNLGVTIAAIQEQRSRRG